MNNIKIKIFFSICLFSIFYNTYGTNIEFDISNTTEKNIYLCMYKGPDFEIIDTIFSENGKFIYTREQSLPHGVYFVVIPPHTRFDFIIAENQDFTIKLNAGNVTETIESTGEKQYSLFLEMQKEIANLNKARSLLNMEKEVFKRIKSDTLPVINKRIDSINIIQSDIYKKYRNMMAPDIFFNKMLKIMEPFEIPDSAEKLKYKDPYLYFRYYIDHYFDRVDFSDSYLLNTPQFVFHRLLEDYCQYFINNRANNLDEVYKDIDNLIAKTNNNLSYRKYILNYMIAKYEAPENLKLEAIFIYLYRKYYMVEKPEWVSNQAYEILKFRAEAMQYNIIGSTAKDLRLTDINGTYHSIYELPSNYKIILFWEPDCDFCSDMALELKDVYETLEAENVAVFAVLTNTDIDIWTDFINENELNWINVYDPDNSSNYETYYGTYKTPRIYILDQNNIILAKDIKPGSITNFIKHHETSVSDPKDPFGFIFDK